MKLDIWIIFRSSLLYPPTLEVKTSDSAVNGLAGSYKKTDQFKAFRPVYSKNHHHIFYEGLYRT